MARIVPAIAATALSLALLLAGCGKKEGGGDKKSAEAADGRAHSFKAENFADKTFAILSGSSFDAVARDVIGVKQCKYYNTPAEAMEAVRIGDADATLVEEPVGRKFAARHPDVVVLYPPVDIENYAAIFTKGSGLRDEFNEFLLTIRSDGVYEDMVKRWVDVPQSPPMSSIKLPAEPPSGRTLVFLTSDCDEPFSYKNDTGDIIGFDIETALRFAQARGYGLTVKVTEFPDMIPMIQAGKADFASNLISVTEERKVFIDFSEPIYYGGTVVLTKKL